MPWPGTPSRRGGPLRVTEHADGVFIALDGVGFSTTLDDLARQQLAAGWLMGTRLAVRRDGEDEPYRNATIREILAEARAKAKEAADG